MLPCCASLTANIWLQRIPEKQEAFQEKIDAALSCGTVPVIIGRPLKEEGLSVAECRHMLAEYFGFTVKPHITLLGIGMGSQETLTVQGKKAAKARI